MGAIGGLEWVVIVLVVLLFFGAKKIPELARGLGQGISEFKKATNSIRSEIEKGAQEPVQPPKISEKTSSTSSSDPS
jgi:sec-independent protein translocase protein TatA